MVYVQTAFKLEVFFRFDRRLSLDTLPLSDFPFVFFVGRFDLLEVLLTERIFHPDTVFSLSPPLLVFYARVYVHL